MADPMQWERFETHWSELRGDARGQMASSSGRVAGLLILKHMEALSDKRRLALWISNPYHPYFCRETHFQHHPPTDLASINDTVRRFTLRGCWVERKPLTYGPEKCLANSVTFFNSDTIRIV